MRVGITGVSGFIGSRLFDEFRRYNRHVRALQHRRRIAGDFSCDVVEGDIREPESLRKFMEGLDTVFHLAAALGASLIADEDFERINAGGTENVLKAAKAAGVNRVIYFSSAGVLGSVKGDDAADENYPTHPKNIYDKTKLMAEQIALRYAAEGMNVVIIRPGWVYGPGDRRTLKLIKAIARGRFFLVTKGDARQTPVHIDDLLKGTLLCAEQGKAGEIYHIAGDEILKVKEVVNTIATATGNRIPSVTLPLFPVKMAAHIMGKTFTLFKKEAPLTMGRLSFFIHPKPLSIAKIKREIGFSPRLDFKTGMIRTVSWYRSQGWL